MQFNKSGYVLVQSDSLKWTKQFMVLIPTALLVFPGHTKVEKPTNQVVIVATTAIGIETIPGTDFCVKSTDPMGRAIIFACKDGREQSAWIDSLKKAVVDCKSILRTYIVRKTQFSTSRRFFVFNRGLITVHPEYDATWTLLDSFQIDLFCTIQYSDETNTIRLECPSATRRQYEHHSTRYYE
jgi:hypothetical protein